MTEPAPPRGPILPGSNAWRAMVRLFLGHGYGVEGVAVQMQCPADLVRAEVAELRRAGKINEIVRQR